MNKRQIQDFFLYTLRLWKVVRFFEELPRLRLIKVLKLDRIPPNSNPFRYDLINMGSDLTRGWVVMHAGFDNKENPFPLTSVIMINTRTGNRIQIFLPKD